MRAFELLSGFHHEGGKEYKQGEIVRSDRNLCAVFKNKFRELVVGEPVLRPNLVAAEVLPPTVPEVESVPETPEVEPAVVPEKRSRRRK